MAHPPDALILECRRLFLRFARHGRAPAAGFHPDQKPLERQQPDQSQHHINHGLRQARPASDDVRRITGDHDAIDDQPDEQRDLQPQTPVFTKAVAEGGFGLAIDSELLRGTSSSCATFQNPPLSKAHANGSPFEILNIEVWTMTPCANVADAENLEMKSLFLESYNRE